MEIDKVERIDLHIHTNLSDGELSPKEIIDKAVQNQVSIIAIADHDTVEAYTEELYQYAKSQNVQLIRAVEISTKIEKSGIHVLGYCFDIHNPELKSKLFSIRNARHNYLYNVSGKLKELGYDVNIEKLDKIDAVTKAHIALDVIENIQNKEILLQNFTHIPTKGEFIETVMNEGCPAYAQKETITPKEAAELIRKAGGKVVLAHPVAYQYEDNLTEKEILEVVKEMKADGIEANYIYINRYNQKVNEIQKWKEIAKANNLITTIGSDFHNSDGIRPEVGLVNEEIKLSKEEIEEMINKLED